MQYAAIACEYCSRDQFATGYLVPSYRCNPLSQGLHYDVGLAATLRIESFMANFLVTDGETLPVWLSAGLGFVLGAVIGSYLATVLWRWPRGHSANTGRSQCDSCDRTLAWQEIVPIAGYALANGRCRSCGAQITSDHAVFELFCALAGAYFFASGAWWLGPIVWLLALLALFDLRYLRLPNPLVATLGVLAIVVPAFEPLGIGERLVGGAIGFGAFWAIATGYRTFRKRTGLGFGDVKLFGAMGLWTGPYVLPQLLLLACAIGFADLLYRYAKGTAHVDLRLPLGTYLCAAMTGLAVWYSVELPHCSTSIERLFSS